MPKGSGKMVTSAILIIAFIMAGLYVHEKRTNTKLQGEIAESKEKIEELEKISTELDGRIKQMVSLNQELEKKYQVLEAEKSAITEKLKQTEKNLAAIQGQVEAMTPDEMVQTTRAILNDSGVDKIDAGARFSLAAFKANTARLMEWREFSLVKIPALEEKVQIQEKELLNLQNQVFIWKETDRLWRQKNTLWLEERTTLNSLLADYQKLINSEKRKKIHSGIGAGLIGFGLGVLIGK
jgi:cell division protein FtsL